MPIQDLFGKDLWQDIGKNLLGAAKGWWDENEEHIVNLGKEEMTEVLRSLRDRDTLNARLVLLRGLTDEEFKAVRLSTLDRLQGMARRRAELAEAIADLSERLASKIAEAAGRVISF